MVLTKLINKSLWAIWPAVVLIVLLLILAIWLLLPTTRLFPPVPTEIERQLSDGAEDLARETNRALRERADALEDALNNAVCTEVGTLLLPNGRSRVRQALQELVDEISATSPLASQRTHFGLVAYRDQQGDGLEYAIKEVLPLARRSGHDAILNALSDLREARASSRGYNEDAFGAIDYTMNEVNWTPGGQPFGAKYIILVTDAGPKVPNANRALYRFEAADLNAAARDGGFGLMALHVLTRSGEANADFARSQYRALTRRDGGRSLYFPVDGNNSDALNRQARELASTALCSVEEILGAAGNLCAQVSDPNLLGLNAALRLSYLGRTNGTQAPDVITGWVSQKAVEDSRREAVSFRLLITRNQLATMADVTAGLIDAAEQLSRDEDLEQFHQQIREMIVQLSQNPERVVNPGASAPGDALEFLENLPYHSRVLRTSTDRWMENPGERREILDGLSSKLASYQRRLDNPDVWQALFPEATPGEHVTTIPVQYLP